MKYVTPDGKFWIKTANESAIVGLTKEALAEYGMFVVYMAKQTTLKFIHPGLSMAAIETINYLGCLPSPIGGMLTNVNHAMLEDDPAAIGEDTILFEVSDVLLPPNLIQQRENNAMSIL